MAIKVEDFIKELKEMKVADLNELVKAIEEEFGVTAAAPVAAAAAEAGGASAAQTVELVSAGGNKIAVIKVIREVMGLALMEAKQFADNGGVIKENVEADEAEALMAQFKEAGADVVAK
jgi:large subunit ribosomal protein L7/L12